MVPVPNGPGTEMSGTEMSSAETAAPKRTRPGEGGEGVDRKWRYKERAC